MWMNCLEATDWSVFKESCYDLDEYTEVVTSYVRFLWDVCVPSKPWFNKEIQILWRETHKAFKSFIKSLKSVKKAKGNYKSTLENKLKINGTYGVWKSLEQITGYKFTSQVISDDIILPDELNAVGLKIQ